LAGELIALPLASKAHENPQAKVPHGTAQGGAGEKTTRLRPPPVQSPQGGGEGDKTGTPRGAILETRPHQTPGAPRTQDRRCHRCLAGWAVFPGRGPGRRPGPQFGVPPGAKP